jgi:hypothetical protein
LFAWRCTGRCASTIAFALVTTTFAGVEGSGEGLVEGLGKGLVVTIFAGVEGVFAGLYEGANLLFTLDPPGVP